MGKSNKLLIGGDDTIYTRHTTKFFFIYRLLFTLNQSIRILQKTKICPVSRPNPSNV